MRQLRVRIEGERLQGEGGAVCPPQQTHARWRTSFPARGNPPRAGTETNTGQGLGPDQPEESVADETQNANNQLVSLLRGEVGHVRPTCRIERLVALQPVIGGGGGGR